MPLIEGMKSTKNVDYVGITNANALLVSINETGTLSVSSTSALATSAVIKASSGTLHSLIGFNDSSSAQYIQLHDSATLPANTAVPKLVITVPTKANFSIDFGSFGMPFANGIVWCNSSTLATKTIGSADCFATAIYK